MASATYGRRAAAGSCRPNLLCSSSRGPSGRERVGDAPDAHGSGCLVEFRLELGLPVWRYDVMGVILEKRVFMPHMQNSVHLRYELVSGADRIELRLRPSVNFRPQEAPVSEPLGWPYELKSVGEHVEIALTGSLIPALRLIVRGATATMTLDGK